MLTQFPTKISAGLSFEAAIVSTTYLAPDWSVSAVLRGPSQIDLSASGDGGTHSFSELPATTTGWGSGRYAVSVRVTDGTDTHEIESGELVIEADLAGVAANHDARGHAQKVLDAIEAVIEGRASRDQQSYTINGRTLVRTTIAELLDLRKTYKAEVAALASNGRHKRLVRRQVKVRF